MSTSKPERPEQPVPPQQPEATLAAIALGCSIVGMLLVLVVLPQVGIILGAFGVTTGWRGRQGNVRLGIATAGVIVGIFAVVVGIAVIAVNFLSAAPA